MISLDEGTVVVLDPETYRAMKDVCDAAMRYVRESSLRSNRSGEWCYKHGGKRCTPRSCHVVAINDAIHALKETL